MRQGQKAKGVHSSAMLTHGVANAPCFNAIVLAHQAFLGLHQMLVGHLPSSSSTLPMPLLSLERSAVPETPKPAPCTIAFKNSKVHMEAQSLWLKCTFSINFKKHIVSTNCIKVWYQQVRAVMYYVLQK